MKPLHILATCILAAGIVSLPGCIVGPDHGYDHGDDRRDDHREDHRDDHRDNDCHDRDHDDCDHHYH
jgi:hypothetical protein